MVDLLAQRRHVGPVLDDALAAVMAHGRFVLGPEVDELEARLATRTGAAQVVTCASGTDALVLMLRAAGLGAGHAVLVPTFTFAATAEAVVLAGAVPVFVDVTEPHFDIDPLRLEEAASLAARSGLTPRAVLAVDLFGQPAPYEALAEIAAGLDLVVLADAAQSFGAERLGQKVGTFGVASATSFFPSKPLGCYGDGGAVFCDDPAMASLLRSLRHHGTGGRPNEHLHIGTTSRLDTLQAAVLLAKLTVFDDELAGRQAVADRYHVGLGSSVTPPAVRPGSTSTWAQYTVQLDDREAAALRLAAAGVACAVHYPKPLHHQPAFAGLPATPAPVTERLCRRVLSLPMHPYLDAKAQARIIDALV